MSLTVKDIMKHLESDTGDQLNMSKKRGFGKSSSQVNYQVGGNMPLSEPGSQSAYRTHVKYTREQRKRAAIDSEDRPAKRRRKSHSKKKSSHKKRKSRKSRKRKSKKGRKRKATKKSKLPNIFKKNRKKKRRRRKK